MSDRKKRQARKRLPSTRTQRIARMLNDGVIASEGDLPAGAVLADVDRQKRTCSAPLRYYYLDHPFTCRRCQTEETWTARQQQW